ncbi:hypothetical protein QYM36_004366 [Artemia franciscana]|uniref:Uncharacterized protein n=1 Tax=Artemia franciscana TaxID=6661 RepID=A0AA88I2S7_ARTSF|nr:hypothetical protein QYM36_004366 [Artemia franciscana]
MIVNKPLLQKTSSEYVKTVTVDRLSSRVKDKLIEQEAAKSVAGFVNDKNRTADALTNLILAVSARIMLLMINSVDKRLVNTSIGYVCGFKTLQTGEIGSVQVKFDGKKCPMKSAVKLCAFKY